MSRKFKYRPIYSSKVAANRANAQSSTGPRTEEGKEASSANALTHGLTSNRVLLRHEDPAEFEAMKSELEKAWAPVNQIERLTLDLLILNTWRLRRCCRVESVLLDHCLSAILDSNPELSPDEALARVFLETWQKKMRLFLRYQTQAERAVSRLQAEMTAHRKRRPAAAPTVPEEPLENLDLDALAAGLLPAVDRPGETVGFVSKS